MKPYSKIKRYFLLIVYLSVLFLAILPVIWLVKFAYTQATTIEIDFSKPGIMDRVEFYFRGVNRAIEGGTMVLKGQSNDGKPYLREYQSEGGAKYGVLEVKAKSDQWAPDTSIGFELWDEPKRYGDPSPHYAILFKEGHLVIVNPARPSPNEYYIRIDDWDKLKDDLVNVRLVWNKYQIILVLNGRLKAVYSGSLIPNKPLRVRLNADKKHNDRLIVYKIYAKHQ